MTSRLTMFLRVGLVASVISSTAFLSSGIVRGQGGVGIWMPFLRPWAAAVDLVLVIVALAGSLWAGRLAPTVGPGARSLQALCLLVSTGAALVPDFVWDSLHLSGLLLAGVSLVFLVGYSVASRRNLTRDLVRAVDTFRWCALSSSSGVLVLLFAVRPVALAWQFQLASSCFVFLIVCGGLWIELWVRRWREERGGLQATSVKGSSSRTVA